MVRLSEDDIGQWFSSHEESAGLLPQLVRMLISSITPSGEVIEIEFAAGKGVHAAGYDGRLRTRTGGRFSSTVDSVWELSVESDCKGKANSDYQKRKADADASVTYVGLTGRRWPGKTQWIDERKKEGRWADVRFYDAVDLTSWAEQSIATTVWLAGRLGKPVHGILSGDLFLRSWYARTNPALCDHVILGGRGAEIARLQAWLAGPPGVFRVIGETRDEATAFPLACLGDAVGTAVVVVSEVAWPDLVTALVNEHAGSVVLPAFAGFDGSALLAERHHLIIPVEPGQDSSAASDVRLHPVPRETIAAALEGVGVEAGRARKIADMSGGKMAALQRICGYVVSQPAWCRDLNARLLSGMLLAGAWRPSSEADRGILCALCNASWDDVEAATTRLLMCPDAPLRRHGETVRFRSSKDAWMLLGPRLTDGAIAEYVRACRDCLTVPDPRYDLPPAERVYAGIRGQVLAQSADLRMGLCNSLSWLAIHAEVVAPVLTKTTPEGVIRDIMASVLAGDWRAWASLGAGLRSMAEAAPSEFLDLTRESIRNRREAIEPLFAQDKEPSVFGACAHADLLWAIESLAWDPDRFSQAATLLCELCVIDNGGTFTNRPFSSLVSLFMPHVKMSAVHAQDRTAILRRLVYSYPDTGWHLIKSIAGMFAHGGVITDNCRPRYLMMALPPAFTHYAQEEFNAYFDAVRGLYIEMLDAAPLRLTSIVGIRDVRFIGLSMAARKIRQYRDALLADPDSARRLRKSLREHFRFADKEGADSVELVKELLTEIEPDDPAERCAWLFDMHPSLPGFSVADYDAEHAEVVRLRHEAMLGILASADMEAIVKSIASLCDCPATLGEMLGQDDGWRNHVPLIARLEASSEGAFRHVAGAFWATVIRANTPTEFLAHVEAELPSIGQGKGGELAALAPSSPEIRDWVDKQDTKLRETYWRAIPSVRFSARDDDDFARIIQQLLTAGRWSVALHVSHDALHSKPIGRPEDILALLRHVRTASPEERETATRDSMFSWMIERLFEQLDAAGHLPTQEIAGLEITYLSVLEHSSRGPRTVIAELNRNPRFLVEVLVMMYRAEGEDTCSADRSEEAARRAETGFYIQQAWNSYPGEGLAPPERDRLLRDWCQAAMQLCRDAKRQKLGDVKVGEVLARVPAAENDGVWPCAVARDLIEVGTDELVRGVMTGQRNARGATTRALDEGGLQERELAARYRSNAQKLRLEYPVTARMLERLAAHYDYDAKRHDVDAEEFTDPWL